LSGAPTDFRSRALPSRPRWRVLSRFPPAIVAVFTIKNLSRTPACLSGHNPVYCGR
jgi:hypothetical protein